MELTKENIEECVKRHRDFLNDIMKKFDVNEPQANQAIDIVCEYSTKDRKDMLSILGIICHTIKRVEDM